MSKKIQVQQDNVKELLQLIKDNPELPIVAMVDSEIVADDGFSWWIGHWGSGSVEEFWNNDERVYIRSIDEDTLIEDKINDILDEEGNKALLDEELEQKATEIIGSYEWKKVIAVHITT